MKLLKSLMFLSLLGVFQGCLYVSMKKEIVSDEATRVPIKFESSAAASIFNAALVKKTPPPNDPCYGASTKAIPLILLTSRTVYYETVCFNRMARLADINGNGIITVEEAQSLR